MRSVQAVYEQNRVEANGELLVLVTGGNERDGSSRAVGRRPDNWFGDTVCELSILSIRGAGSTIGNAAATAEYIRRNPHAVTGNQAIEIVTNDYHMLRAWIIFSKQMRDLAAGPELTVPPAEMKCIGQTLANGLPGTDGWSPSRMEVGNE